MEPLIVVDAGIPNVRQHFEGLGRVRTLPAREIDRSALREAHALVVRSITRVDASLLQDTGVRFVGTATSGVDHVDRVWLRKRGIRFAHARGANAESVADYVVAALLLVASRRGVPLSGRTAGIIGCGNVGGRLAPRLRGLGMEVLLRDPPKERRARSEGRHAPYVSLERVLKESDIVSLHTPLNRHGRDRTHHLVDAGFLAGMRKGAWLVNTARGPIVDERALVVAAGRIDALVLDVWEDEPRPDPVLVERSDIATAHIAGYAVDSKREATRRVARALARHLGREHAAARRPVEPLIPVRIPDSGPGEVEWLHGLARTLYALERDDANLRRVVSGRPEDRADGFEALRSDYPERRIFSRYGIRPDHVTAGLHEAVFGGLGVGRLPA